MVGACVLGVVTFMSLSSARQARQPVAQAAPPPAPKPIVIAAAAAPAPVPVLVQAAAPQVVAQVQPAPDARAPAMVVDFSQAPAAGTVTTATTVAQAGAPGAAAADDKLSPDERFSAKVGNSNVDVAHSSRLRDLSHTAPQGTVIPAVLETAINSDLPGFVRAVVSRDVRGFDGTTVLIPRGSKLMGQYRSGVALSQTRAFVVWSRVLTPDGVSIDIGSPGTDQLGRGGIEGETDTHFFERFGSAILLSVMGAGLNALTERNTNTAIIIGSPQQASQVASIALQKNIDIPVTIKVAQGTPLQVFVTRDLDFRGHRHRGCEMTAGVYLDTYLSALAPWLTRDDVTDLLINRPGEVWIETTSGMLTRIAAPQVTEVVLSRLARQIAAATHQGVNREQPLLSATLPDGGRVQIIAPPATRERHGHRHPQACDQRPVGGRPGPDGPVCRQPDRARGARRATTNWRRC